MIAPRNVLLSLTLGALALLPQAPLTSRAGPAHAAGWSVQLRTDRPFYTAGDSARASFRLDNLTAENTFGLVPKSWTNGCAFSLTVLDAQGQTVWQPFTPCFFGMGFVSLDSGELLRGGDEIPLVYQNNAGIGTAGAPLPPGPYRVCLSVSFSGPTRDAVTPVGGPGGLGYSACVPIRIEP